MSDLNPPDPHPSAGRLRLGAPRSSFQSSDMESILPAPPNATTLGLMTKYWDIGRVKTRLGEGIGMARAAALHRIFVTHLCHKLGSFSGRRLICLAPDASAEQLSDHLALERLEDLWEILPQGEGNLGARMARWFQQALATQTSARTGPPVDNHAILIGADCPMLDLQLLGEAQKRLASHDVVIGPAMDGGYYLIGLSGPWVRERFHVLFHDIPWSTERVLDLTRERLSKAQLSWSELEPQEDIDTVAELQRLREQLRSIDGKSRTSPEEKSLERLGLEVEMVLSAELKSEHAGSNDFWGPST